jgi:hypothetical protein
MYVRQPTVKGWVVFSSFRHLLKARDFLRHPLISPFLNFYLGTAEWIPVA